MAARTRGSSNAKLNRRRLVRWGVVVGLLIAVVASAVVLNRGVSWRDRVSIARVVQLDQDVLALVVNTCGEQPDLDLFDEQDNMVQVAVVSTHTVGGQGSGDCQDIVEIRLQSPLGDRPLIDVTTGAQLTVDPDG